MKRMFRKMNSGMSLIEVIVSMLVLAIIAVPLLNGFVLSSNINNKTRIRQYATALAQNVMEGIKANDISEVAVVMNEATSGSGLKIVPISAMSSYTHGDDYYETTSNPSNPPVNATACSVVFNGGRNVFRENAIKKYYYILKGVTEGTKKFDVKIEYDGSGYLTTPSAIVKQNGYEPPILSDFDMETTALINPNGSNYQFQQDLSSNYVLDPLNNDFYGILTSHTYDDYAIDYLYALYTTCVASPSPSAEDALRRGTSRDTIITISNSATGLLVNCKYVYKYDQSVGGLPVSTTGASIEIFDYPNIYNIEFSSRLKNIYLFHVPLEVGKWNGSNADKVIIKNLSLMSEDLNVFIAEQPLGTTFAQAEKIVVKAIQTEAGDIDLRTNFYYAKPGSTQYLEMDSTYSPPVDKLKTDLINKSDIETRIYEVTVSVYLHNSTELLYQLQSTITR